MNDSLLPSRYAKAFYKYAVEHGIETPVYEVMRNLAHAFEGDEGSTFRQAIANPFVSDQDKRRLVYSASGLTDPSSAPAKALDDFLSLLLRNNRVPELRGIVYAFDSLYRKEKNISRVHVTWASTPAPDTENRLKKMIVDRLGNGQMEYSSSTDPDLIGGFKINIDNEQLDASVQNELRQLRQKITSK